MRLGAILPQDPYFMPTLSRTLILFTSIIFVVAYTHASANEDVQGRVIDAANKSPLQGTTVVLASPQDSTIKFGAITAKSGSFAIKNVPPGPWRLSISFIGFRKYSSTIFIRSSNVDLGTIALQQDTVSTKTINVEADAAAVQVKGDTTEYNSKAYKTNVNASAEDLVKKMPGVNVEGGTVTAHGEDVRRVLVDGREFFGDDPSSTLRNVPADMVDRVQVYDRGSDMSMFSGFDDGNTQKTINLITKRERRKGEFGKFYGGYGSQERYAAGATFNYFDGPQRLVVLGLSNNINQQNFSAQDIVGSMGIGGPAGRLVNRFASSSAGQRMITSRSGSGFGGRGDFGNLFVSQQNGVTTTHALGTNYSNAIGDDVNLSGSYFFNYADNGNKSSLNRDYVTPKDQFYTERNDAVSLNRVHRLNLRVEATIDSLNSLILAPRFTLQDGSSFTGSFGETSNKGVLLSTTQTNNSILNLGIVGSGSLTFRHRFGNDGRNVAFTVNTDANSGTSNGDLVSSNEFSGIDSVFALDQISTQRVKSSTYSGTVAWTEPIFKDGLLQVSYTPSVTQSTSDKLTSSFNSTTGSYSTTDTLLTNNFKNTYTTQRTQALYRWQGENTIITAGAAYQFADLTGQALFPASDRIVRTFNNVLPSAMWQQKFSRSSNIRLRYSTSTSPPSVSQLQNVVDNTNPIQLKLGNPNLVQDYTHNLSLRFINSDWMSNRSMFAFVSISLTNDYIGSTSVVTAADTTVNGILLPPGAQITAPQNLDGYISIRSRFSYGIPISFIPSNVNLNTGINYSRVPGLVNGFENFANTTVVRAGFFLSSNISEDVDIIASYDGQYNIVVNSLQRERNANYFTHNASGRLIWNIGAVACSTDVSNTFYTGLGPDYDRVYTVWNAGLGYRFFDNNAGELRITVFDLLRQNDNVGRSVNDIYVEDSQSSVITRYAMLTFTYDLKSLSDPQMNTPH
ncbi:MAG: outer membrane beta-barrel protein [Ignavibacteria bacterium]|nr:outer membrane beta-barrel protein [Ignavibacteria bacterium]